MCKTEFIFSKPQAPNEIIVCSVDETNIVRWKIPSGEEGLTRPLPGDNRAEAFIRRLITQKGFTPQLLLPGSRLFLR